MGCSALLPLANYFVYWNCFGTTAPYGSERVWIVVLALARMELILATFGFLLRTVLLAQGCFRYCWAVLAQHQGFFSSSPTEVFYFYTPSCPPCPTAGGWTNNCVIFVCWLGLTVIMQGAAVCRFSLESWELPECPSAGSDPRGCGDIQPGNRHVMLQLLAARPAWTSRESHCT